MHSRLLIMANIEHKSDISIKSKRQKILVISDTKLNGTGIISILEKAEKQASVKVLLSKDANLNRIERFKPDVIINSKYKKRGVKNDSLLYFLKKNNVKLIFFSLEETNITVFQHKVVKDASIDDLFDAILK
ncbi:MAG: hypothetical protein ACE5EA_02950 [Nitrospirota bacterium]